MFIDLRTIARSYLPWTSQIAACLLSLLLCGSGQAQTFQWAQRAGGVNPPPAVVGSISAIDFGSAVAVGSDGAVYVAGQFGGTASFGNLSITSSGGADGFLAKYNRAGAIVWVRRFGGPEDDPMRTMTIDAAGNILVCGAYKKNATFGSIAMNPSTVGENAYVVKLDASGNVLWVVAAEGVSGSNSAACGAVAVDTAGNVTFGGRFIGSVKVGATTLASAGSADIFLVRISSAGAVQSASRFGGANGDSLFALAVDGSDTLMTGAFSGTLTFGATSLVSAGSIDMFLTRLNPQGQPIWAISAGGTGQDLGSRIAVDSAGAIYLGGRFSDSANFGATTLAGATAGSGFVAKYTPAGSLLWARVIGSATDFADVNGVVALPSGKILIGGSLLGPVSLPGGVSSDGPAGVQQAYVARLADSGIVEWVSRVSTTDTSHGATTFGIAGDSAGNAYATGLMQGSVRFGATTLVTGTSAIDPSTPDADVFVTKILAPVQDIDGDGQPDLLWQNTTTGDRYAWFLNGASFKGDANLGIVPTEWTIAATGDFNRDGWTDLVWFNTTTRVVYVWFMRGTTYLGDRYVGYLPGDWRIGGAADFSGDGQLDLLLESLATGSRWFWFLADGAYVSGAPLGTVASEWSVAGTSDFNGDGKPDIVWENTVTGTRYLWLMDGTSYVSGLSLGTVSTDFSIAGVVDLNRDGKPDILWQNTTTGTRFVWYMDGVTYLGQAYLGTVPTAWSIVR